MKPLPMPLRIAAGLVATAIEEVQELPRKLTELPVTAVSQALQASMRVQQRFTELAIKGDRALGGLRPVPETPTWARFDEDELERPFDAANGLADAAATPDWNVPPPRRAPRTVSPIHISRDPEPVPTITPEPVPTITPEPVPTTTPEPEPVAEAEPKSAAKAGAEPAVKAAVPPSASKPATEPPATEPPAPAAPTPNAKPAGRSAINPVATAKPARDGAGPKGLEDYDTWTLPQLRGRFRALSVEQVQALLTWETSHQDRPPYVTMLSNRLASITGR